MPRVLATFVAVIALVVGVFVPVASVSASPSATIGAAQGRDIKMSLDGFDPGNIISDAVFTNRGTMTEAQIQAFFNSKVARCQGGSDQYGPIVCLKDFTISSVNRPADRYCQGYSGAPNESAARIIYRVAQSCGINPQVLIVMLQKEQGLVTHTWPSMNRYNAALGQGCPDGGVACDPNYVGFFHQIYGAARQMQIYMEGRYFTYYAPGKTWNIQFNPNRNCGTAPVYVANMATSALYYYTPYQPNAAAMRAGYGEGDACSAYGNRNFYNYFTDWFGSTKSSGAQILRDTSTNIVYLVSEGTKYRFPTPERWSQFAWLSPTQNVSASALSGLVDGGSAPRAIRTDQGHVYLLDSGRRLWVPSCALAADYGWSCGDLPVVAQGQANGYPDGGTLAPSVQTLGVTYLIQSSSRREIVDRSLLAQYGISTAASSVAGDMGREYALGDPVFGAGVYYEPSGKTVALLGGGGVYNVQSSAQVDAVRASAHRVSTESLARLKPTGDLPLSVKADGRTYVLGNDGWMLVDAYGTSIPFTSAPSGALNGQPQTGAALGPHFVRERSGLQVFLISGGVLQAVSAEEQRWISAQYGVSPTVRILADSVLGSPAASGKKLVKTAAGAAYLIDGTSRYRFRDCAQVADWGGSCDQLVTVTDSQLTQATDRGWLNPLVRLPDGTTWLVQSGSRREVVDTNVLAPYGIGSSTTSITAALAEPLKIGLPVLGSGVYSDGGSGLILVNTAGSFSIPQENRLSIVTRNTKKLSTASFALMPPSAVLPSRLMSDGGAYILTELGWLQIDPAQYGGAQLFATLPAGAKGGIPVFSYESRPHFVRERSSSQMFLASGGMLMPIEDEAARAWTVAKYGVPGYVWQMPDRGFIGLLLAPGLVYRDTDSRVLLSDGNANLQFSGCDAIVAYGRTCSSVPELSSAQLGMTSRGWIAPLLRGPGGDTWLVQSGARREVPDVSLLAPYGIGSSASTVSASLLSSFAVGDPVVGAGAYRNGAGAVKFVVGGGGRIFDVPAGVGVDALSANAKTLTDGSFSRLASAGAFPLRVQSGATSYVLSTQGWLTVTAANYAGLSFTTAQPDVVSSLPSAGAATGPRFVREASGSQVYLASGGLTPVSAAEQATITRTYGVPSQVLVLANGTLR